MKMTPRVRKILSYYESDNPGTKANLARILMQGRLGGTGRLVILPVDQGFEHGPARSFAPNPPAYDPHYHFKLAIEAGLSAYASPLGFMEGGASTFACAIPTILKVNSANSLARQKENASQAITATARNSRPLARCIVLTEIWPLTVSTCSSRTLNGIPASVTAARARFNCAGDRTKIANS